MQKLCATSERVCGYRVRVCMCVFLRVCESVFVKEFVKLLKQPRLKHAQKKKLV